MAIATRPRRGFHWKSPWLIGTVVVAMVIAGTAGVGLATGLFLPGGQSGPPIASSPAPATNPTASPNALDCQLPVVVGPPWSSDSRYGAWLNTATGAVVRDPAASESWGSYSSAAGRWLPVNPASVSPDGLSYAYIRGHPDSPGVDFEQSELHVVDISSGRDSAYTMKTGMLQVVAFTRDAIYLQWSYEVRIGLLRFDLASHSLTTVSDRWNVWITDGKVAWAGSVNAADPHPIGGIQNQPDQVDRIDLATGTSESWLYRPHSALTVLMTDALGRPIVWISYGVDNGNDYWAESGEGELVLVDRPGHAITLAQGKDYFVAGEVDQHGAWLGGTSGIFLLTSEGSFRQLSSVAAQPAGACQ